MAEGSWSRFTAAEGGARLAAAARRRNTIAVELSSFVSTRLLHEEAYMIRGPFSAGKQRSVYVTRASRVPCVGYELRILTDLAVCEAVACEDVEDWGQEIEVKEVLVCTSAVLRQLLEDATLVMTRINVLVIDSCHLVHYDEDLQTIMDLYKSSCKQPRVLGLTYPLFTTKKPDAESESPDTSEREKEDPTKCAKTFETERGSGEFGVCENVDDFDMYGKLEWNIQRLEDRLCCQMDLAEDIDGGKRFTTTYTKPKELIVEYSSHRDVCQDYEQLEQFMRDTVREVTDFLEEHRYDPSEIYGEDLYEEFMNIPNPTIDPKMIFKQFTYVLDELGPYGADKAAFSLLTRLEKLKIKVPYERHFLLLCLCTTVLVKIRCYAEQIFSKYTDLDRITTFSTPKVLRFIEILMQFENQDDKSDVNNDKGVENETNEDENQSEMISENINHNATVEKHKNYIDTINNDENLADMIDSNESVEKQKNDGIRSIVSEHRNDSQTEIISDNVRNDNETVEKDKNDDTVSEHMNGDGQTETNIHNNYKQDDMTNGYNSSNEDTKDKTRKLLNDIDQCDFLTLSNKIEDKVNTFEANLKEIHDIDVIIEKNENSKADATLSNTIDPMDPRSVLGFHRRPHRVRGRGRVQRNVVRNHQSQQNPDALCGIVFMNEPIMAKIMFLVVVELSRSSPRLSHLSAQYCLAPSPSPSPAPSSSPCPAPARDPAELRRHCRAREDALKKFRMHDCNLLLATSALEEGIDLPRCNLVLRWDVPSSYRSHGLCRGRARAARAACALLVRAGAAATQARRHHAVYRELDQIISRKCGCGIQDEPPQQEEDHADAFTALVLPYSPSDVAKDRKEEDREKGGLLYSPSNLAKERKEDKDTKGLPYSPSDLAKDRDEEKDGEGNNRCNNESKAICDQGSNNIDNIKFNEDIDIELVKKDIGTINLNVINKNEMRKDAEKLNEGNSKETIETNDLLCDKISEIRTSETNLVCNKCSKKRTGVDKECCVGQSEVDSDIKKEDMASVDLSSAIALINRYCGKLPSDTFTRLAPSWRTERVRAPARDGAAEAWVCTLRLPLNCPVKCNQVGHPMPTRVLARRMAALQACRVLHKSGELDDHLMPIGKENFKAGGAEAAGAGGAGAGGAGAGAGGAGGEGDARPGTTKRRQYYYKRTARAFTDCEPIIDTTDEQLTAEENGQADKTTSTNVLYAISCTLWCGLPERYNTRGRRLHAPQLARQAIGVLLRHHPTRRFMRFVFADVLRVRRRGMTLQSEGSTHNNYYVVPTVKVNNPDGSTKIDIDWKFLEEIYQYTEDKANSELEKPMLWPDEDEVEAKRGEASEAKQNEDISEATKSEEVPEAKQSLFSLAKQSEDGSEAKWGEVSEAKWGEVTEAKWGAVSGAKWGEASQAKQSKEVLEPKQSEVVSEAKWGEASQAKQSKVLEAKQSEVVSEAKWGAVSRAKWGEASEAKQSKEVLEAKQGEVVSEAKWGEGGAVKRDKASVVECSKSDNNEDATTSEVSRSVSKRPGGSEKYTREEDAKIDKRRVKKLDNPLLKPGEIFVFDPEKYREAVVTPWYRNRDQPQFFLVAEICSNLTPDSEFPSDTHTSFRDYYKSKYGVTLTQPNQPLLDVDHTSARLNLLTPRYVNRKGVALPVSSERTRRAKRDRLDQKQILVPELCAVHPFAAPLWFATVALPCVLYRINALLIADEIRQAVATDVGLGIPRVDDKTCPGFQWPPLDFGWSLAEVLNADSEKSEKKKEEEIKEEDETELRDKEERKETKEENPEPKEKTINDILQEKEDAESGFEIGTWDNDMAASIPETPYDEFLEPLPPNLTFCTSASGGVNWCEPVQKPKNQFNPTKTFSMADSDCSYMSRNCDVFGCMRSGQDANLSFFMLPTDVEHDFDTDDSDLNSEDSDETETSGFCSGKSNAAMGVRIEYKTAHEAEAVDLERQHVHPAPQPDPQDDEADRKRHAQAVRAGDLPTECLEKFNQSVANHEKEIIEKGLLITEHQPITDILPDTLKDCRKPAPIPQQLMKEKLEELFPYNNKYLDIENGPITLEDIEKNKRYLLNEFKKSLTEEEIKKYTCFSMIDIDIDSPEYKNEKVSNIGFDEMENYKNKVKSVGEREFRPYYEDNKGQNGKEFDFDYQPNLEGHPGPSPSVILQALTMSNANDGINLERLETIGDSFLKFAITAYLYCAHPTVHEGKLSHMRSKQLTGDARCIQEIPDALGSEMLLLLGDYTAFQPLSVLCQVSNLNLYRLGVRRRLGARMIASKFEPHDNWLPPCHRPPPQAHHPVDAEESNLEAPLAAGCFIPYNLITQHSIPDKSIADCVEALIGAYLLECGPRGALLFMAWLGIRVLPRHDLPVTDDRVVRKLEEYKKKRAARKKTTRVRDDSESSDDSDDDSPARPVGSLAPYQDGEGKWFLPMFGALKAPPSPLLRYISDPEGELERMLSGYDALERTLQYRFRDRSLLLQALTHASHQRNRLTDCYQRLEFLGDAILDYLITRHLYEDGRRHSPGALTDLRSALVNNTIFATLAARHGFHRYFRHMSPGLNEVLTRYVKIQEENGHSISEEHYLIHEDELEQAEDVEVPKALGDLFESVAGAIFLDSGMSLAAVWRSYELLMGAELEAFSAAAPKSPVRELLEAEPDTAKFGKPERLADGRRVRVCVEVFGRGAFKGVGRNYRIAKGTAARCALRHLKRHKLH